MVAHFNKTLSRLFGTDIIDLYKKNGETHLGLKVQFDPHKLICNFHDAEILITTGDEIDRHVPGNDCERYIIIDPGYSAGMMNVISPSYSAKVAKF